MVIGDFGKLSFERQSELILEMKRSENFYSFTCFDEMSDYPVSDIRMILTGSWVPDDDGHIREKFTEMIKDSVIKEVYDKTPARDVVLELAEEKFNLLTDDELEKYITQNLPQMQRYLTVFHADRCPLRDYYIGRTVCINNYSEFDCLGTRLPRKSSRFARWYRLDDEDVLFELNKDSVILFDDLSFSKPAYLAYYNEQHRREKDSSDGVLDICENADLLEVHKLMKKYGLTELREADINDIT